MNKFDKLVQRVIKWSEGIDLYSQSTVQKQELYAYKELSELIEAVEQNDIEEIKDGIGDTIVCMINANQLHGLGELSRPVRYLARDVLDDSIEDLLLYTASWIAYEYTMALMYLSQIAAKYNLTVEECLEQAVKTIEKRKVLMVNGIAVKWENMTDEQKEQWRELNAVD